MCYAKSIPAEGYHRMLPEQPTTTDYAPSPPKKYWVRWLLAGVGVILLATIVILVWPRGDRSPAAPPEAVPFTGIKPNDKDGDGFTDEEEAAMGTNDWEFDSDGDGLSDTLEMTVWHTDPSNKDTDGDGFVDGYEITEGFDPLGEGKLPAE